MVSKNKKAIIWSGIDKVASYFVNFALQVFLARLLLPEDYTIIAMLAIFFAISQAFIDSGFATTLIQRKHCSQSDYNSVFYFNILVALIIYGILFVCAPAIENFYHFPGLCAVTRIYSLTLIISSLSIINRVKLTKELKFKSIAILGFISSLISGLTALMLAGWGCGYWALVAQSILSAVITCGGLFIMSGWRPEFIFSFKSLRNLAPFGLRMLVVYMFHAVYNNIYSLMIGKKFAPQELGYYDRGRALAATGVIGFSDFFTRALYPIQSQTQDNPNEVLRIYSRAYMLAAYVICPLSVFLCIFSDSIVYTLYGEKWMPIAWIQCIMAVGFMVYPLQAINMNILKAMNRPKMLLHSEAIKKILGITVLLVTVNFGMKWVVYGWLMCSLVEFLISEIYCRKCLSLSVTLKFKVSLYAVIIPSILCVTTRFLITMITTDLFVTFMSGGIIYLGAYAIINRSTLKKLLVK